MAMSKMAEDLMNLTDDKGLSRVIDALAEVTLEYSQMSNTDKDQYLEVAAILAEAARVQRRPKIRTIKKKNPSSSLRNLLRSTNKFVK